MAEEAPHPALGERIGDLTMEVRVGFARVEGTLGALLQADVDRRDALRDHEMRLRDKADRTEVAALRDDIESDLAGREKRAYAIIGVLCSSAVAAVVVLTFLIGA